ncbi:MAG: biopolymer transporter ExbD [Deltaproteobacteria bacterium]|nr:biopolymer transporter ExbD [Deltaproteobacteria bacterium]
MSAVSGGARRETLSVNVVNLIDILIILLVFLLTNFATSTFEDLTSVPAGMPVWGRDAGSGVAREKLDRVEVRMESQPGFTIVLGFSDREPAVVRVPANGPAGFDYARLSRELLSVKQSWEFRHDVLLEAEKDLSFDVIVKAMDAIRSIDMGVVAGVMPLFPRVALTDIPN